MLWKLIGFHRMIDALFNEHWVSFGLPEVCAGLEEFMEQVNEA